MSSAGMPYIGSVTLSVIIVNVTRLFMCETGRITIWLLAFSTLWSPNNLNASASGTIYCVILIAVYEVNISYKDIIKVV